MNHVDGAKKSPSDVVSYICFYLTVIKNRLIGFRFGRSCIFFGNGQLLEIRYEEESALEFISAFVVYKQMYPDIFVASSYLLESHSSGAMLL